jgi:hypothetical protein
MLLLLLLLLPAVDCVLHIASTGVGGLQHRTSFEHCCDYRACAM